MSGKRNQAIAIARFLMYKYGLNQQLESTTDKEYLEHPIGLDVDEYVADLMKYCPEHIVDQVMKHRDALLRRLGTDHLTVIACMPYEDDGYFGTDFERPGFQEMLAQIEADRGAKSTTVSALSLWMCL